MIKIYNGQINKLSFIYQPDKMTVNSFGIYLQKEELNYTKSLTVYWTPDGLDGCRDFIVLLIDLRNEKIPGGDLDLLLYCYDQNLPNMLVDTFLCHVVDYDYENQQSQNEVYLSTVKINNL